MENFNPAVLIIGAIGGLLSAVGIGAIAKMALAYFFKQKDSGNDIHRSTGIEQIKADSHTFDLIYRRVEKLENDVATLQKANMEHAKENAHLDADNKRLTKENERLTEDILNLRDKVRTLTDDLTAKTIEFEKMKITVKKLTERLGGRPEMTREPKQ